MMRQGFYFPFSGFSVCVYLCTINWGEFVVNECETVILILARLWTLRHCARHRIGIGTLYTVLLSTGKIWYLY
jgi:hypothetical protein